jgi:molybdate-binding protein/DNA-binding XRE family transcriptional regulator
MAAQPGLANFVRESRMRRNWSQEELAQRAGLSRAGVSAIETGRLVPSTAAALALAAAFGLRVEDLFRLPVPTPEHARWAWPPPRVPCRYWSAEFESGVKLFPVEATPLGVVPHDGVYGAGGGELAPGAEAARTLVMACCDPAVGLLAAELARTADIRLIVLPRPSRAALALLGQGAVHAAGVHLSRADTPGGNAAVVKNDLGSGFALLGVARWEEGITFAPRLELRSVGAAVRAGLRWVGREDGSGARQCLDELLEGRTPRRLASDHRGVAEAVRNGWADAGVCLRLVSEEAGLEFLGVRFESYELCLPATWKSDPRLRALVSIVRSSSYRRALGELPGYDSAQAGELNRVV